MEDCLSCSVPPDYDNTLATSGTNPVAAKPGFYLWTSPDKPVAIHLSLDIVDRLLQDVMRGFGAVPKRGAEVGGILTGHIIPGDPLQVEVDGYELVPIEYRFGPSYLLSDADRTAFGQTLEKVQETGAAIVGFFRSTTRDAVGLVPEDLELLDHFFPQPDSIVLMIRPYATRVSTAGFYFREDGRFQSGPPLAEFNFRRKDLGGGEPAPPRVAPLADEEPTALVVAGRSLEVRPAEMQSQAPPQLTPQPEANGPTRAPSPGGWVWVPLSLIFLLLGILLGFQASLTLRPQASADDDYKTGLNVSRDGDNLSIRWDRQAPAIRAATKGVLTIEDGSISRTVSLSPDQLQTGSVVYPHKTGPVRFRLELTLKSRALLAQQLDWNQ